MGIDRLAIEREGSHNNTLRVLRVQQKTHLFKSRMPFVNNGQLDAFILASMGYEQELSRGFRNWAMSAAFGFVAIGTVPFIATDMYLSAGGPATALATWVVTAVFSIVTTCALAEICSSFPNAGAMYHWTGQLVPPSWSPLASFINGSLLLVGNITNVATTAATTAQWLAAILHQNNVRLSSASTVGLAVATVCVWALLNCQRITRLAMFFSASALVVTVIAIVIVVVLYSAKAPTSGGSPWLEWENETGFVGVDGYVVLLGLANSIYSLSGYDVSWHIAREFKSLSPSHRSCLHAGLCTPR